ncbi:hypothetical protein CPB84DRAFT_1806986 [Gymnopilus junonius]|uniref:Uncharacterized protein n=1 Tax=Gymnopilus junonius TaxID=109634 RepID=A0A9P5N761_GYMJU|nr:hypothetical protein CPB84DRAFT_1806986 [Gymnopilus junonius]
MLRSLKNALFALLEDSTITTEELVTCVNHCTEGADDTIGTFMMQLCEGSRETAYPRQSGFRITQEKLRAFDRRDCLYRFR